MSFLRNVRPIALLALMLCLGPLSEGVAQVEGARHMLIIGVDGLSPDGIRTAATPHLDRLLQRGAHTFHARAVMPSSSSSNWASMIMGAGPERHGITSNDWEPDAHELPPVCTGPGGLFPTIFSVLRAQRPAAKIAVFHDWGGFGRLLEQEAPDLIDNADGPDTTTAHAVAYLKAEKPLFTFVHLDHVDHAGHEYGHGTPEYYASVEHADRLIGELIGGLEAAGLLDETVVLVTADHGGKDKGHGGTTLAEMEIPWIIAGPGVRRAATLAVPVDTYDTAATAAYVFGADLPDCWTARPVRAAFAAPSTR